MIITLSFILLAVSAAAGAAGILFLRRTIHCAYAYLACCTALVGLCLLLDLIFLALFQLFTALLVAALLAAGTPDRSLEPTLPRYQHRRWLPMVLVLIAISIWAILQGKIGEPILQSIPMWAIRGEGIAAFGQEIVNNHLVLLGLVGLLLLASVVSLTHLTRQSRKTSGSDELDRLPQQHH